MPGLQRKSPATSNVFRSVSKKTCSTRDLTLFHFEADVIHRFKSCLPKYCFRCLLMVHNLPMEGLRSVPLRGSERQIGFAAHRSRFLSPAVRAFWEATQQTVKTR